MWLRVFFPCCQRLTKPMVYSDYKYRKKRGGVKRGGRVLPVEGNATDYHTTLMCGQCGKTFTVPLLTTDRLEMEMIERRVLEPLEDHSSGVITFSPVLIVGKRDRQEIAYLIHQAGGDLLIRVSVLSKNVGIFKS